LRLTSKELSIIKSSVNKLFKDGAIYLFGSRIDNSKKGGDIDLYIITNDKDYYSKKLRLKSTLEDLLYKPVDIVISKNNNRAVEKEALKNGVLI